MIRRSQIVGAIAVLLVGLIVSLAPAIAVARELKGEAWSRQKVAEERNLGKIVFVEFRADWCAICKLNDLLVFRSARVRTALNHPDVAFMIADYTTQKDPAIRQELEYYQAGALPMYLVFAPEARRPKLLPQMLSVKDVLRVLPAERKK